MDPDEWHRSLYGKVVRALEEALSRLGRSLGAGPDADEAVRWGMFHLGEAGGLAFSGRLPGVGSEALFDDISDAAERRDPDRIGEIREAVAARPPPDRPPDGPSSGGGGLDWAAGPLQMSAVVREWRTAREEGDAPRSSLTAGFLAGLMSGPWWSSDRRFRNGSLGDAVLAVHDRDPEKAVSWVRAEVITDWGRGGEPAENDPRALLLQWVAQRVSAAHRLSSPLFWRREGETEAERRDREASERAYFEREERSVERAQNFGKRIAGPDREGIAVPGSYALNRALVLQRHGKDDPAGGEPGR